MFGKLFGRKTGLLTKPNFQNGDVDGFWVWFHENFKIIDDEVRKSREQPMSEALMDELQAALKRIHQELCFEIGRIEESDLLDIVLSANGIQDGFPAVLALHRAIPANNLFISTAFRPRRPEMEVGIDGRYIGLEDVRFVCRQNHDGGLDVDVFLPLPDDAPKKAFSQFGFLMLDCALGEYDVATSMGNIEFMQTSQAPFDARPLPELAALVDRMNAGRAKH